MCRCRYGYLGPSIGLLCEMSHRKVPAPGTLVLAGLSIDVWSSGVTGISWAQPRPLAQANSAVSQRLSSELTLTTEKIIKQRQCLRRISTSGSTTTLRRSSSAQETVVSSGCQDCQVRLTGRLKPLLWLCYGESERVTWVWVVGVGTVKITSSTY